MTKIIIRMTNTSDKSVNVVLEPLVHIFPVLPSSAIEVHVDEAKLNQPIEIEYAAGEIVVYAGGILSAWVNGNELEPRFRK